jgi:hypothetical protein
VIQRRKRLALGTLDAVKLQHDPKRGRPVSHVLLGLRRALQQPGELAPGKFRSVFLVRCFSTRIRTSASVVSSLTSGMMIGRGNGRDQFGACRGQTSR